MTAMTKRILPLLFLAQLTACGTSEPTTTTPLPHLYWDVQQVTASLAIPRMGDSASLPPQFLPDGSVVYQEQSSGVVHVFHPDGSRTNVAIPEGKIPGGFTLSNAQITWYQDEKNYGGSSTGIDAQTLTGGWVLLDGTVRECEGRACTPVLRQPDGTFVTRDTVGQYWMTWKPGQNPAPAYPLLDDLDIHDAKLNLVMPCFVPQQVGTDGSILVRFDQHGFLDCKNNEPDLPRLQLIRNFSKVDIGKTQFDLGFAVQLNTCCDVWGINNIGQILGLVAGIPAIRSAAGVETVGTEMGEAYAFNDVGDVLYATGVPAQKAYLRLHGDIWPVESCGVLKQLDGSHTENPLLTHALAMRNDGAVLFWDTPSSSVSIGSLYLATPRTAAIPLNVHGQFAFALQSGAGPAPADLLPWRIRGAFAETSVSFSLSAGTENACVDRTFSFFANRSSGAWHSGDLIPATTSVLPGGGTVVGVVSFAENNSGIIAVSGGFRVSDVSAHQFTVTAEDLLLKHATTGAKFAMAGSAVVSQ